MATKTLPMWSIIRVAERSWSSSKATTTTALARYCCAQGQWRKTSSTRRPRHHSAWMLFSQKCPSTSVPATMATKSQRHLTTTSSSRGEDSGDKTRRREKKSTSAKMKAVATQADSGRKSDATHPSDDGSTATIHRSIQPQNSPSNVLDELDRLIQELQKTNSHEDKQGILSRFASLAPILQWTYDPYRQFHVTPPILIKYSLAKARAAAAQSTAQTDSIPTDAQSLWETSGGVAYDTLDELLEALSKRDITGHRARDSIMLFLSRFCAEPSTTSGSSSSPPTSLEDQTARLLETPRSKTFFKILDKNLKAGCSVGLIGSAFPNLIPRFHVALGHSLLHLDDARKFFAPPSSQPPKGHQSSDILLTGEKNHQASNKSQSSARSGSKSPVHSGAAWFGSRKLDGVRCLITINLATGEVEAVSRSGRPLETLGDIEKAVFNMVGGSSLEQRTKFFAEATGQSSQATKGGGKKAKGSIPASLVLDGEICVLDVSQMNRMALSSGEKSDKDKGKSEGPFDFDRGGIGQENFLKTVGYILRSASSSESSSTGLKRRSGKKQSKKNQDDNDDDSDREDPLKSLSSLSDAADGAGGSAATQYLGFQPVYCIFDCLTEQEFRDRKGTRRFSERIQGLWRAMDQSGAPQALPPDGSSNNVRILSQHQISTFEQLEQIVAQSLERDWEGVMLRKDVGYEGRRSRNLLKIKKFQDAEFLVEDVLTGMMRLPDPVTGHYENRQVLASVVVRHKGSPVRVGSGFSVEDRIRYGQRPELLVGKTITVQYFEESTSTRSNLPGTESTASTAATADSSSDGGDDGSGSAGAISLRFPTVKAIYESGERDL